MPDELKNPSQHKKGDSRVKTPNPDKPDWHQQQPNDDDWNSNRMTNLIDAILVAQSVFIDPIIDVSSEYLFVAHDDQSSVVASFRKRNPKVRDPLWHVEEMLNNGSV